MKIDQNLLNELENNLTKEIRSRQDYILEKLRIRLQQKSYSFQRFNGLFGGKNNTYVDSVSTQFSDFNDFYAQWLKGLVTSYELYPKKNHSAILLKDSEIESFVRLFLERNFYRNLKERTRLKPEEKLWAIWFGYQVIFGLMIAPVNINGIWRNDRSEIRRVDYEYWTLGHVFKEGLIDFERTAPFRIGNLIEFENIFLSIFKQVSNSIYEKKFFERYIEYLRMSNDLENEPLLIPEVRYKGLESKHKYRLDFTILNVHTKSYVGFEISPASSHIHIKGYKQKQLEVNNDLTQKWDKEMQKRNDYFKTFGITTITFSDDMLKDLDSCWSSVEIELSKRSKDKTSIHDQLERLSSL